MFNSILTLFFVTVISSCAGKMLSSTETTKTTTHAPPTTVEATKTDSHKQQPITTSNNWPKVDAYDCKGNNEVRSIHIELATPTGCKLWYSNHSKSEPVAWSKHGLSYCEKVNQNIRHNLENAGYTCAAKDANKPTR